MIQIITYSINRIQPNPFFCDFCDFCVTKNNCHITGYEFPGSYATPKQSYAVFDMDFHFYVRDHLGSNVMVLNQNGIEQQTRYYPFGGIITQNSTNPTTNHNKYTGKEFDRMHGLDWYDYVARQYDPVYGRFTSIDPLCEKYPNLSPYTYCGNNPMNAIDVNGDSIIVLTSNYNYFIYNYENNSYSNYINPFIQSHSIDDYDADIDVFKKTIDILRSKPEGNKLIRELAENKQNVLIRITYRRKSQNVEDETEQLGTSGSGIVWNPNSPSIEGGTPYVSLSHEFFHSRDRFRGTLDTSVWKYVETDKGRKAVFKCEKDAVDNENLIRLEHGLKIRESYEQEKISY